MVKLLSTETQLHPANTPLKPEWLRLGDATRLYGIGRSSLYELIAEGKIKSACLRKRGNTRGIRLLSADSISAYIESIATE